MRKAPPAARGRGVSSTRIAGMIANGDRAIATAMGKLASMGHLVGRWVGDYGGRVTAAGRQNEKAAPIPGPCWTIS